MNHHITIKRLQSMADMKAISGIERAVWDMDSLPVHQTFTAAQNGGILLAAYDNERPVGFLYSFPGYSGGHVYLCSHMLGVMPDMQKHHIGWQLKQKQYEWAYALGYPTIVWTFDPLLSVNAYLNLHKLHAYTDRYDPDYYGAMDDALNASLPTDRFLIRWPVVSPTAEPFHFLSAKDVREAQRLAEVTVTKAGEPQCIHDTLPDTLDASSYKVPIPADFLQLKANNTELALQWRMKTRRLFTALLQADFVAVDLIRTNECISHYVFVSRRYVRKELNDG